MLKLSRLAALLIAGAIVSAPALAAEKGKAFATVNGQPISQSVYNAFVAEQKAQGAPDSPELQNAVKEELVRREILAQEAKKKGLDKSANIQGQIELAKQAVLIRAYLSEYVKANPISDAQLKAEYELIKTNLGSTEYKARHVLVEKEDEAKAIIAKLEKGEKFEELAKQSKDPGSKDKGGDLGWANPGQFVPEFEQAMNALPIDGISAPTGSRFGWHLIQVLERRSVHRTFRYHAAGALLRMMDSHMWSADELAADDDPDFDTRIRDFRRIVMEQVRRQTQ